MMIAERRDDRMFIRFTVALGGHKEEIFEIINGELWETECFPRPSND